MEFTPLTSPALSAPDPLYNGRTMITPGNHQISCWLEKPGVMADVPLQLLAKRTHGVVTSCALRIQLGPPFLRGGQRLWHGRSYSPSELRYTPRPVSRDRRSKSHSPASVCRRRTPTSVQRQASLKPILGLALYQYLR